MREAPVEPTADEARGTVCDEATLAELRVLLGHDHLKRLLSLLVVEIRVRFSGGKDDRIAIAQDAHALLASSGSLGFLNLSRCCSMIEQACLKGDDIAIPLQEGRIAADRALTALAALGVRE
ncbi:Hpt domain-containing protein [Methylobacterium sp. E-045]|uniref:Hpt domain-containing protein n=1 Tax=Methylobacterium sp. E-045 TaxID=2836575 RepID=UPI001FB8D0F1|nr:Hpt domain-containing protein [Methylobacterium sp. E-045]MCJ2132341.1 Hpt domain-containing protein [Methylobacterium sp. E-045]